MLKEYSILIEKEKISELLKEQRAISHLSVDDVLTRLKEKGISISPKTLYGYENGVGSPKIRTFLALCDIYGIKDIMESLDLITETPPTDRQVDNAKQKETPAYTDEDLRAAKMINSLPEEDRKYVLGLLERLENKPNK
ncbi:MAG: hypothetical protein FWG36_01930 [Oscillospiraceae bacterium]|nr:hypothetical protein [Oscillospiraceae bacterium]